MNVKSFFDLATYSTLRITREERRKWNYAIWKEWAEEHYRRDCFAFCNIQYLHWWIVWSVASYLMFTAIHLHRTTKAEVHCSATFRSLWEVYFLIESFWTVLRFMMRITSSAMLFIHQTNFHTWMLIKLFIRLSKFPLEVVPKWPHHLTDDCVLKLLSLHSTGKLKC